MAKKKPEFNDLLETLIEMLKAMKQGALCHAEHKCETGARFERRTFETTTLGKDANQTVKIVVHKWWGER